MSENIYELGDEFEGGPAEISRWITEVTSKGYDFHLSKEGVLTIISVPGNQEKKSEAKAPVAAVEVVEVEEVSEIAEEAVATIKAEVTEAVEEAIDAAVEVVEEVVEEVKPAPVKRGRKPKATAPETTEE